MSIVHISVYYNIDPMAMINGFKPDDRIRIIESFRHVGSGQTPEDVLSEVFVAFNDDPPAGKRSMSIGDVVVLCIVDREKNTIVFPRYHLGSNGWRLIE